MALMDKHVAVTPVGKDERGETRAKARAAAGHNDWLAHIVRHHEQIEALFTVLLAAPDEPSRRQGLTELALILTAHANAEEAVIYPALVHFGHGPGEMLGYTQQAEAKAQLGELAYLDSMSPEFCRQLQILRSAVLQHMNEEEGARLLALAALPANEQELLTSRYLEEFERYTRFGNGRQTDAATARREALSGGHILAAVIP
jgi:hemerythrin superfamily protein